MVVAMEGTSPTIFFCSPAMMDGGLSVVFDFDFMTDKKVGADYATFETLLDIRCRLGLLTAHAVTDIESGQSCNGISHGFVRTYTCTQK